MPSVELSCEECQIDSLPAFPRNLRYLSLGNNPIGHIPEFNDSLTEINLRREWNLHHLPPIPSHVTRLWIDGSAIDSLPVLPDGIVELSCRYTNIKEIKNLPQSIRSITIANDSISCLPHLPDSLISIDSSGTLLTCLPNVSRVPCYYTPPLRRVP
jgi:Leucine-rich repeat (LRR) protein